MWFKIQELKTHFSSQNTKKIKFGENLLIGSANKGWEWADC